MRLITKVVTRHVGEPAYDAIGDLDEIVAEYTRAEATPEKLLASALPNSN